MNEITKNTTKYKRIGYAADLHLNFLDAEQKEGFFEDVRKLSLDGLILAGDTSVGSMLADDLHKLAMAIEIPIWFTLGNHCWWMDGIEPLRNRLTSAVDRSPWLHWLDANGPAVLCDAVTLVGVDNWADNPWDRMSRKPKDWLYISDFVGLSTDERLDLSKRLSEDAARRLKVSIEAAAKTSDLVLAACHIPYRRSSRRTRP